VTGLIILFVCLMAIMLIIIIHETGHFLAGIIFGIPFSQIKICLFTIPQCVALKDGDNWLMPKDRERFVAKQKELIKNELGSIFFVAGGLIVQTIVFSSVIIGLKIFDIVHSLNILRPITAAITTQLFFYLLIDLKKSNYTKSYWGDFTGLLKISRFAAYAVIIPVVLIHLMILIYVVHR
jgi:hypothetical protein